MDHLAAVGPDSVEGGGEVGHLEIGQRDPIAGPGSSGVNPEAGAVTVGLPTLAFVGSSVVQANPENR